MTVLSAKRLEGKRAVVTGASSGIGRAIALAFARAGASVVVNYRRSAQAAADVVEEGRSRSTHVEAIQADVSQLDGARSLLEKARRTLGGIDIWVNNAGADIITGGNRQRAFWERLDQILAVDVRGTVYCCTLVGDHMAQSGQGVILNLGWDRAWIDGMAGETAALFALGKASVMGYTKSLARSLAPEVRVNCLAPGFVRTAWGETASDDWQQRVSRETPLGRWGDPDDVARAAVFLASDDAAYITGQILYVNGGLVM